MLLSLCRQLSALLVTGLLLFSMRCPAANNPLDCGQVVGVTIGLGSP
jgi:hypothetical protein